MELTQEDYYNLMAKFEEIIEAEFEDDGGYGYVMGVETAANNCVRVIEEYLKTINK